MHTLPAQSQARIAPRTTGRPEFLIAACVTASWGVLLLSALSPARAQEPATFQMHPSVSREEVIRRTLSPYAGQSVPGVDVSTLQGKVLCGYQGWFTCPGDGSGRDWHHYSRRGRFQPGSANIDLWPDVSELSPAERFPTAFRHADGSVAEVCSPMRAVTVARHFQWMKDYGIDGVFVQRFGAEVQDVMGLFHFNQVLANCRAGANQHGRTWAVMYDLSGLPRGGTRTVMDDWKQLVDRMRVGRDPADRAYLHHNGKPVVAVWGVGFSDNRRYTLEECGELIDFLTNDPQYGGNTVMLGVPTYWRTLQRDALADGKLHDVIRKAQIVSPWMVGRAGSLPEVRRLAEEVWRPDLDWCGREGKDYLPVVFPGFSWHNMNPSSPLDQIPRQQGKFLWEQYAQLRKLGITSAYQAMFDELDEGTAIFKCTSSPPVGESRFLDLEGLPSDHYLWLTGQGGRLLRGELASPALPIR